MKRKSSVANGRQRSSDALSMAAPFPNRSVVKDAQRAGSSGTAAMAVTPGGPLNARRSVLTTVRPAAAAVAATMRS